MSTNEQAERVEVTPELLDAVAKVADKWLDGTRDAAQYRSDAEEYNRVAQVSVVRALVERIRALESAAREAIAEHDHQVECWEDHGGELGTANAEYHRLQGDLLRSALLT